ncbi:DUF1996 domain-containing protein [Oryzihumus sp.]|uniref:DUF1996 domain-containing protein n=1 Tax=Oryzihumus sp. TaxID=1968903 RepID=UPI002ED92CFA
MTRHRDVVRRARRARTAGWLAVMLGLAAALVTLPSVPASAMAKIQCKQTTGTGYIDPIVHHDQPIGYSHLHQFFGNNAWLALANPNWANYANLVGKGTNCANLADTAGYWSPALRYTASGSVIPAVGFWAYYRSYDGSNMGPGMAFPADTRLVATVHNWTCGQFERQAPVPYIPDCHRADGRPGHTLTAHIDFPSCWNGVRPYHPNAQVGDTRDNRNYAYAVNGVCPTGFPYKMVQLRETIAYAYHGYGTDVQVASDPMMGMSDGMSMHADFWNTWNQAGLQSLVVNCISGTGTRTKAQCG